MGVYDAQLGGNTHTDVILTNIVVRYPNEDFTGSFLLNKVSVAKQSNKYRIWSGKEMWTPEPGGDFRAPGTESNEIPGLSLSLDTYYAQEHSLQISITDEERENVDSGISPDKDGAELVTSKLLLGREIAIKTMVTTAANYASGMSTTLSGTNQWSDYANSNPINDIKVGRRAMHDLLFLEPNVAVIPYQVMIQLEDHPDFIERIKYSERGIVSQDLISALFGGITIHVPGMGYNSANPGQTAAIGYLWGKDVLLAYVPGSAVNQPAFAAEFVWGYGGKEMVADRWREEKRKCDVIRVSRRYDHKFIAVDGSSKATAGYLIKAAVA